VSTEQFPGRDEASPAGARNDRPVSGVPDLSIPQQPWVAQTSGPPSQPPLPPPPGVQPTSGAGQWAEEVYEIPAQPPWPVQQQPGNRWPDPLAGSPGGRRIEPTVAPRKSRLWLGLLIGFLVGVLIAAPTVFVLRSGGGSPASVTPSAAPTGAAALGVFEKSQLAVNQPKFQGDLAVLAASWLPFVSNCVTDKESGGPKVDAATSAVVLCRYGNVFIHFVQFKGTAQRDVARAYRERLHTESTTLAPGMVAPAQKPRTSDSTIGTYVEYALAGPDKKPVAGIWWDTGDTKAVAVYLETSYDSLGNSWDPLRDLWQRHS
jgi:hypothetical protein